MHEAVGHDDACTTLGKVIVAATGAGGTQRRRNLKATEHEFCHWIKLSQQRHQIRRKDHRVIIDLDVPTGVRPGLDHRKPLRQREAGQVGPAVDASVLLSRRPRDGDEWVGSQATLQLCKEHRIAGTIRRRRVGSFRHEVGEEEDVPQARHPRRPTPFGPRRRRRQHRHANTQLARKVVKH